MRELLASLASARKKYVGELGWSKELFDRVASKDPSPTKKYLEWMCGYVHSFSPAIIKSTGGKLLLNYAPFKIILDELGDNMVRLNDLVTAHLLPGFDIKAIPYNSAALKSFIEQAEAKTATHSMGLNKLKEGEDYEKVFESDTWVAFLIHNYKASRILGSGTPWCVVANESHYDDYTKDSKVFVFVINKGDFKDKYAVRVKIRPPKSSADVYPFTMNSSEGTSGWTLVEITSVENRSISVSDFEGRVPEFNFKKVFDPVVRKWSKSVGVLRAVSDACGVKNLRVDQEGPIRVIRWDGALRLNSEFFNYIQGKALPRLFSLKSGIRFEGEIKSIWYNPGLLDVFDFSVIDFKGSVPSTVRFSGAFAAKPVTVLNCGFSGVVEVFTSEFAIFHKVKSPIKASEVDILYSEFPDGVDFVIKSDQKGYRRGEFSSKDVLGKISVEFEGEDPSAKMRGSNLSNITLKGRVYHLEVMYEDRALVFSSPGLKADRFSLYSDGGSPVSSLEVGPVQSFVFYPGKGPMDLSFLSKIRADRVVIWDSLMVDDMRVFPNGADEIEFSVSDQEDLIFRLPPMKRDNSVVYINFRPRKGAPKTLFSGNLKCVPNPSFNSNLTLGIAYYVSISEKTAVTMFGPFLDALEKAGCLPERVRVKATEDYTFFDGRKILEQYRSQ